MVALISTFQIKPRGQKGTRDYQRAKFTIDTLKLESGKTDLLLGARRNVYASYLDRFEAIITRNQRGENVARRIRLFKKMDHRSVWEEMKRSHQKIAELKPMFEAFPEALNW